MMTPEQIERSIQILIKENRDIRAKNAELQLVDSKLREGLLKLERDIQDKNEYTYQTLNKLFERSKTLKQKFLEYLIRKMD